MNRKIKFRVWNIRENKMIIPKDTDRIDNILTYWETNIKVELMQYTGLKDKNGTDLFEGDIVTVDGYNEKLKVVYDQNACCFDYQYNDDSDNNWTDECFSEISKKCEIVGNLFEK